MQDTVFKLSSHGMKCAELSGDMNKEQRQNTMRRFQQGEYRALIVRWPYLFVDGLEFLSLMWKLSTPLPPVPLTVQRQTYQVSLHILTRGRVTTQHHI